MKITLIEKLNPVNFAYVMATGTISTVLYEAKWQIFSNLFLILATLGYCWLSLMFGIRIFIFTKQVVKELTDAQDLFKYLTFSAGSNSLATRFILADHQLIGIVLGSIGIVSTILLIYTMGNDLSIRNVYVSHK